MDTLNYADFDYSKFSYIGNVFPKTVKEKPKKLKKIVYLQVDFRNNQVNENMGLSNIDVVYDIGGDVK
jgi:hypothetical protein